MNVSLNLMKLELTLKEGLVVLNVNSEYRLMLKWRCRESCNFIVKKVERKLVD